MHWIKTALRAERLPLGGMAIGVVICVLSTPAPTETRSDSPKPLRREPDAGQSARRARLDGPWSARERPCSAEFADRHVARALRGLWDARPSRRRTADCVRRRQDTPGMGRRWPLHR